MPGERLSPSAHARWVALAIPVALLGGALFSQYVGGLHPCEMCIWQRWPHGVAIIVAALAFLFSADSRNARLLVISDDNTLSPDMAGRSYGRVLGSSSGVDIRV